LSEHEIRVVDNQPVLFSDMVGLWQQLTGPVAEASTDLFNTLYTFLPFTLANHWRLLYDDLAHKFNNLSGYHCSSGEKIMVSFFRALMAWDDKVRLLIVDECDAVLDQDNRRLFLASLHYLAQFVAVFYVSHSCQEVRNNQSSHVMSSTSALL
jgi:ABC-type transport system involved in cytochrome bd biosynthesis fused ATPase/permease subunit